MSQRFEMHPDAMSRRRMLVERHKAQQAAEQLQEEQENDEIGVADASPCEPLHSNDED